SDPHVDVRGHWAHPVRRVRASRRGGRCAMNGRQLDAKIRARLDDIEHTLADDFGCSVEDYRERHPYSAPSIDALRAVLDYADHLETQTFCGIARRIRERIAAELGVQP